MQAPRAGQRWLRKLDNQIIFIDRVRDCGMLVDWHYAGEPDITHTSDGLDFTMWNKFTLIE